MLIAHVDSDVAVRGGCCWLNVQHDRDDEADAKLGGEMAEARSATLHARQEAGGQATRAFGRGGKQ